MAAQTNSTFRIESWDEKPYDQPTAGPKLTRASVAKSYKGDLTGEGKLEYLMMHRQDGSASFVGLERIVGTLGKRSGSFVLRHEGTFSSGVAKAHYVVLPDSGTEELTGLRGEGEFEAGHQESYAFVLRYEFD